MKDICNRWFKRIVRLACISGLTFFVCLSCTQNTSNEDITIEWKDGQAVAITIPSAFTVNIPDDSIRQVIAIGLEGSAVAMLGDLSDHHGKLLFTPVIPFTHGMRYEVRVREKRVGSFGVKAQNGNAPTVMAIYPSADTLPENLLKIYLHFDQPMREGFSGRYVTLVENRRDTVREAFLDLQPELWNAERTTLTLWLDPGRIKRDLQPNKRLGVPMQSNAHYQIIVSEAWQNKRKQKLAKPFRKSFVTARKDTESPEPSKWMLLPPASGTMQAFQIDFHEPLDHCLLQEVFQIQDDTGKRINGKWQTGQFEKQITFSPEKNWVPGQYKLLIETRLEDLAGNNLIRPFDRDMTKTKVRSPAAVTELAFTIR